jgi:transcriptional regulator with XRE-family HTH domain
MAKPSRPPRKFPPRTLRVLRAEREISQKALAEQAGITQTRFWQIEHGQGAPIRKAERKAIATLLHVAPHEIAWPEMTLTALQVERAALYEARAARRRAAELASLMEGV